VNFQIGDSVQVAARVGTITDIGTVLIQYNTNDGGLRVGSGENPFAAKGSGSNFEAKKKVRVGHDRGTRCARGQLGLGGR
jgi:hypothetical protein